MQAVWPASLLKALLVALAIAGIAVVLVVLLAISGIGAPAIYTVADEPTALMGAARRGDVTEVQRLLAQGADIDEQRGTSRRVGFFVVHGPSTPRFNETALLFAIEGRSRDTVIALLDGGASASVKDSAGSGIWDYALSNLGGSGSGVLLLLAERFPFPPDRVDSLLFGMGPGEEQLLEFALALKPSEFARENALCQVAKIGDILMMDRLLQTFDKAPVDSLACAIKSWGDLGRAPIEYLLAHGADPNGTAELLAPPLSMVLEQNLAGTDAQTPLRDSVRDVLELLLSHGANPHLTHPERIVASGSTYPATLSPIELARSRNYGAAAAYLENWRETDPQQRAPYRCPLICFKSDQLQGCACGAQSAGSDGRGNGYLIEGFGPGGQMAPDGRYRITLSQVVDGKPIKCHFTLDGKTFGRRTQACGKAGPVEVRVLPQ